VNVTKLAILLGAACAACTSFNEPAPSSAGDAGTGTVSEGGAPVGGSFCASRSGYDVCSDFDDGRSPSAGWDRLNGPTDTPATIDSSDAHSAPSSLRFDLDGKSEKDLGLTMVLGPGTVYHVEFAVRFDRKVQSEYVDVARVTVETKSGPVEFEIEMRSTGLHYTVCPADTTKCLEGNPEYDLLEWKTFVIDIDLATSGKLLIGGVVIEEAPIPGTLVDKLTVTVGPSGVAQGNTVVVRYDDVLITHH
jgi:hypothetical protein